MSLVDYSVVWSSGLILFAFLISGCFKIVKPKDMVEAMAKIAVPYALRRKSVAVFVSGIEILIAVLMLLGTGGQRMLGALLTIFLLSVFSFFLSIVIRRGETVDCGCFGALSLSSRITMWSLVRNGAMMLVAMWIVFAGGAVPSVLDVLRTTDRIVVAYLIIGWLCTGISLLFISNLRYSKRAAWADGITAVESPANFPMGVTIGSGIPESELVNVHRGATLLKDLGAGGPALLVFVSGECGSCREIIQRIPNWEDQLGTGFAIIVATSSRPDIVRSRLAVDDEHLFYGSLSAREALGVTSVPAAVALGDDQNRILASPVVFGSRQIETLVESLVQARA